MVYPLFFLYLIKNIFKNRARVVPFVLDEIFLGYWDPFYLINSSVAELKYFGLAPALGM
jgi:hypothetical protein